MQRARDEADRHEEKEVEALAAWEAALGHGRVLGARACAMRYGPNVSEYEAPRLVAALQPRSTDEVVRLVDIAGRYGVPLYPISTGGNWGLGSKLPPSPGCAIVDLSAMDRILEIDGELGLAVVEPGVNQAKLAAALQDADLPWRLNVTGAGGTTSVVANALERGVGMLGQRHRDIRALEVVLGTGALVRLGFDHLHYPLGAGPDMTGLFAQSGFGIVTAAAIRLHPREGVCLFFAETEATRFPAFVDDVRRLRQRGLLAHRTEIMAANDPRLTGRLPEEGRGAGSWGTWGTLYGDPPLRRLLADSVRDGLSGSCRAVTFFDEEALEGGALPPDVEARLDLARGIPSNYSIETIPRSPDVAASDLDLDRDPGVPGMLAVLPAVPLLGARLRAIVELVRAESAGAGVDPVLSFSTVSEIAAEGFIRAHFDRRDRAAVDRVHDWARALDVRLRREGLPLLRLSIGQMASFASADGPARECLGRLGQALDPQRIIAPGRYDGAVPKGPGGV